MSMKRCECAHTSYKLNNISSSTQIKVNLIENSFKQCVVLSFNEKIIWICSRNEGHFKFFVNKLFVVEKWK